MTLYKVKKRILDNYYKEQRLPVMLPFPVYDVYINKPNWLQRMFRVNNWIYCFTSEHYPDYVDVWNVEGKVTR